MAQRTARRCANNYWLTRCQRIHLSPDTGNMYDGTKKAVGPGVKKTAPLKYLTGEILTDRNKQMERWVDQYVELYSRETIVTDTALGGVGDSQLWESSMTNQL